MFHARNFILVAVLLCSMNVRADDEYQYRNYDYNIAQECTDLDDPWEKFNRKVFTFNGVLDYFALRPIAKGYRALFSDYTRDKIGNFIDNINVPLTFVSNVAQLDANNTLKSFWQFIVNTTLGVGGVYDVAANFDVKTPPQTFGSILAHYGVHPGPYVVLPLFGGTNVRDALDVIVLNNMLNPIKHPMHRDFKLALTATTFVQKRADILPFTDYLMKNSADVYTAVRSSLHQAREATLHYPKGYKCERLDNK